MTYLQLVVDETNRRDGVRLTPQRRVGRVFRFANLNQRERFPLGEEGQFRKFLRGSSETAMSNSVNSYLSSNF